MKITTYAADASTKQPRADLDATNRSSKASDYVISVEHVSPSGERHTEAHTSITHPAPEQVAHDRAGSPTQVNAPVTCRITNVIRVTP
ncbi:hypothetical protein [Streptomyces exfoliatus]|uniref:hypothetical protein n=1 Tax=Streptomyces exfoliatus TaxID=1905 RepID=UPI0004659AEB|nr:hypothetical protein [Streptomyces exfoliatus]